MDFFPIGWMKELCISCNIFTVQRETVVCSGGPPSAQDKIDEPRHPPDQQSADLLDTCRGERTSHFQLLLTIPTGYTSSFHSSAPTLPGYTRAAQTPPFASSPVHHCLLSYHLDDLQIRVTDLAHELPNKLEARVATLHIRSLLILTV